MATTCKSSLEITGSLHQRGQKITGWIDGRTTATIKWREVGGPEGSNGAFARVVCTEREALASLRSIDAYAGLELISADLEVEAG